VLDLTDGLVDKAGASVSDPHARRCVESELERSADEVLEARQRSEAYSSTLGEGRSHGIETTVGPVLGIGGSGV
jgi:hypothetical protein